MICEGLGLFATRDIPKGTPITRYHGEYLVSTPGAPVRMTDEQAVYAYQLSTPPSTLKTNQHARKPCRTYIIGESRVSELWGKGLAQFANDALHQELTGHRNNCEFIEVDDRVYICATYDIPAHNELLVSYHLSYWMGMLRDQDASNWPDHVRHWVACHCHIEDLLRRMLAIDVRMDEYLGVTRYSFFQSKAVDVVQVHDVVVDVPGDCGDERDAVGIATYSVCLTRRQRGGNPTSRKGLASCTCSARFCSSRTSRRRRTDQSTAAKKRKLVTWSLMIQGPDEGTGATRISYKCITCGHPQDDWTFLGCVPAV
jgi:hypothetical protein